ncbi:MAG: glycoside hydrolase family 47 protein [Bacteroidota bacterium]
MVLRRTLVVTLLATAFLNTPARGQGDQPIDREKLAGEVKAEFLHAWNAYKKYAWGHDILKPLSKSYYDWHDVPIYLTPIDALDTMELMGLTEEADSVREFLVNNLSFDQDIYVKNFEMTIRVLGGLLSSYQLTQDIRLLDLAKELGDRLLPAFQSPTGMPYVYVNLKTGAVRDSISNPAEIGTLLLEFGALSALTGDNKYYHYAKFALLQLYKSRSKLDLVGQAIDVTTGEWVDSTSHISAAIDSYYEYLAKGAILFNDKDCEVMFNTSLVALKAHVLDRRDTGTWYGHVNMNTGERVKTWFGALDVFFPAVLALVGDTAHAADLFRSSLRMWNKHGIEPAQFDYEKMEVVRPRYYLNPEIMESTYYLYKVTGDEHYLRVGKALFDSLKTYCRVEAGYAELASVITKEKYDRMESYFLAETLKYLYLLFAPAETLDFKRVIFNTEAHPIQATW